MPTAYRVAQTDIILYQNESVQEQWSIVDTNGQAIYLTGTTIRFEVFSALGDIQTPIFHYTTSNHVTVANNVITVSFQQSDLSVARTMQYAIWNDIDGTVLATGKIDVMPMVRTVG